jgi:hypothetical protein
MRLLPKTPRGTWLLAVAVWLAGSSALWWVLPYRPRAVTAVARENRLLGIGPGGRTVLFEGVADVAGEWPPTVPVRLWDTAAASVRTVLPARNSLATLALSPDGRWLAVGDRRAESRFIRLIDLTTGRADELTHPAGAAVRYEYAVFSPDSRWLAVAEQEREDLPGVRLWDVSGQQPSVLLAVAVAPVRFSRDGQRLAAVAWSPRAPADGAVDYAVWEVGTGRELARLRKPGPLPIAAFTPDGTGLIVQVSSDVNSPMLTRCEYACWDIADGRERWSVRDMCFVRNPVADGRLLVMLHHPAADINEAILLDAASGAEVRRTSLGVQEYPLHAGTDGRSLLVATQPSGLDAILGLLSQHGLPGPQPVLGRLTLLDAATGRRLYTLPGGDVVADGDLRSLAVLDASGNLTVWDVPPRKPLVWFVPLAALLVLLPAWLARRQVRRLWAVAS